MNQEQLQREIIKIGNDLIKKGLTSGTGGNISGRLPGEDWFYISPSGIPYADIKAEDLVKISLNGEIIGGKRKPSIEYNMHLKIFQQRDDVYAVVHTHSFYAKAVAAVRRDIPPILDIIAIKFGGPIEVTEYARPGSLKLAENTSQKLQHKNGVLVANHGAIGVGQDFEQAMEYCDLIEESAKLVLFAKMLGNPVPLTREEIEDNLDFFCNNYGQG